MRAKAISIFISFAFCCLLSCGRSPAPAKTETPEESFAAAQAAAQSGDVLAFYDRCDEKGRKTLFETAMALFTMDMAARKMLGGSDINALQRAFEKELGVKAEELAASETDPLKRREVLALLLKNSPDAVGKLLKESLAGFAQIKSTEFVPLDADNVLVTLKGPNYPKLRLTRSENRWLIAGGLSYPGEANLSR